MHVLVFASQKKRRCWFTVDSAILWVNGFFGQSKRFGLGGHGEVTDVDKCGHYRYKICDRLDLHNRRARLLGDDAKDEVFAKPIFFSCGKVSCPECFAYWVWKEAGEIERRLAKEAKACGLKVEHASVSFSFDKYADPDSFDEPKARAEARKALKACGAVGGCLVLHGARRNKVRNVYRWSVHYHYLGFFADEHGKDGYARCRSCKFNGRFGRQHCWECDGFEGAIRRENLLSGALVKVLDSKHERKSVWGTAKYELGHVTIDYSKRRFHAITWFGKCSYRNLKVEPEEKRKDVCGLCSNDLVFGRYVGTKIFDKASPDFRRGFRHAYFEDGRPVWLRDESSVSGS